MSHINPIGKRIIPKNNVLLTYLPKQLSAEEISQHIADAIAQTDASSIKDMGKVIAVAKSVMQGKADMSLVSKEIKEKLSAAG